LVVEVCMSSARTALGRIRYVFLQNLEEAYAKPLQESAHTNYNDDRRTSDTVCSGPVELSVDRHSRLQPVSAPIMKGDMEGGFF
jgi:hypothetical protein